MINYSIVPPLFIKVLEWEFADVDHTGVNDGYIDHIYDDGLRLGSRQNPYWRVRHYFDTKGFQEVKDGYWITEEFDYSIFDSKGSIQYVVRETGARTGNDVRDPDNENRRLLYTAPYMRSDPPRKV